LVLALLHTLGHICERCPKTFRVCRCAILPNCIRQNWVKNRIKSISTFFRGSQAYSHSSAEVLSSLGPVCLHYIIFKQF